MNPRAIQPKIWLYLSAGVMFLSGFLRGIKGFMVLTMHHSTHNAAVTNALYQQTGLLLIMVMIVFFIGGYMLLKYRNIQGWLLGWLGIIFLIVGTLLNDFLLFVIPSARLLAMNGLTVIIIATGLILGKKAVIDE